MNSKEKKEYTQEEVVLTYEADSDFMESFLEEIVANMFNDVNTFGDFFIQERLKAELKVVKQYLKVYPDLKKETDFRNLVE